MAKRKNDEPTVTIGRRCPVCGELYVLSHPKDYTRPLCDDCMAILKEIINERKRNTNEDRGMVGISD